MIERWIIYKEYYMLQAKAIAEHMKESDSYAKVTKIISISQFYILTLEMEMIIYIKELQTL